jgi:sec-independent protein translocase protein TatA
LIGGLSPLHWILIIAVVALLFGGRGKISALMGDTAKGIKAFKEGLKGEDDAAKPAATPAPAIPHEADKEEARR